MSQSTSRRAQRRRHVLSVVTWTVVCALTEPFTAAAKQDQAESAGEIEQATQYAKLYDDICYSNLPDFSPIMARAKKQKWKAITGTALKAYAPEVPPDQLKAWSFLVDGVKFHVSISSGPADKALQEAMPAFAKSRAFACSLILPGHVAQPVMDDALQNLVGRPADAHYEVDLFKVHFWSGITDQLAALMYHYKPKSGGPGGLISFVVLKK